MPQEELDDVDRLCEAYLSLLFAPEVALDVEEPLGREIVREFLGYDRAEYLWRKIGEAEDANHVWSVHLQPLRKLLHVGERPAFEEPVSSAGEVARRSVLGLNSTVFSRAATLSHSSMSMMGSCMPLKDSFFSGTRPM